MILNKTRPLGIPRARWIDVIAKDLKYIDQNVTFESIYDKKRSLEGSNGP